MRPGDPLPDGVTANPSDGKVRIMVPTSGTERRGVLVDPDEAIGVACDLIEAATDAADVLPIRATMLRTLADDPDAALLATTDDFADVLDDDTPATHLSLFAGPGDEFDDELARRLFAELSVGHVARHFPNETKHGAVSAAGGQFTAVDGTTYSDPTAEWEREYGDDGGSN